METLFQELALYRPGIVNQWLYLFVGYLFFLVKFATICILWISVL
jgi:hypothetical protein